MSFLRTYNELMQLNTFEDRFNYLSLKGAVSKETFGFDRYLNQKFYKSREWESIRNKIMIRDNGCDMALADFPIHGKIIIHHMNPVTLDELKNNPQMLLNPEYLICVSHDTHNYIHYGDSSVVDKHTLHERVSGDTLLWKSK